MNEIKRIALTDHQGDPVDYKLKAVAVRPEGDQAWQVFMAGDDHDSWLSLMELAEPPDVMAVHPQDALYYVNCAQLLGDPWDQVWDNTAETICQQQVALEALATKTENMLRVADPFDVRAFREQFQAQPWTDGEVLRCEIAGVHPFAGRN